MSHSQGSSSGQQQRVNKKQNDTFTRSSLAACGVATFCPPEISSFSPALVIVLLLIPNEQLSPEAVFRFQAQEWNRFKVRVTESLFGWMLNVDVFSSRIQFSVVRACTLLLWHTVAQGTTRLSDACSMWL